MGVRQAGTAEAGGLYVPGGLIGIVEGLAHPVNFVIPEKYLWSEIRDGRVGEISDELLAQRCVGAINNWVVIPFVYFHRAGLAPSHSPRPREGAVNIASAHDLGIRERPIRAFIVCCRADAHVPKLANFVFEQNKAREGTPGVAWTPHWPNPGLIPRDPSRGDRLETLAYKGDLPNLWRGFRDDGFRRALAAIGVDLRLDLRTPNDGARLRMHDYRDVDAVIAARNLTEEDVKVKPASKLVNAWLAGVPALLGPEPGFQELRSSAVDYIEITSPQDAVRALERLKRDPALARQMRERGKARAQEFTVDALVRRWVGLLNGPVADRYAEWARAGAARRLAQWVAGAFAEKRAKAVAARNREFGRRPFD